MDNPAWQAEWKAQMREGAAPGWGDTVRSQVARAYHHLMKPSERKRIARVLEAAVPGLHQSGRVLAATPVGRILRGLYMEDSSDAQRIYLWAFVQPLFVPSTTVVLSLGIRLGGGGRTWAVAEAEDAAAATAGEGVRFFGPISSGEALASWGLLDDRSDEYAREARAYAIVASGRHVEGARALRAFSNSLSAGPAWMAEMKKRADDLARTAEIDGAAAQERLALWESETKSALRIAGIP